MKKVGIVVLAVLLIVSFLWIPEAGAETSPLILKSPIPPEQFLDWQVLDANIIYQASCVDYFVVNLSEDTYLDLVWIIVQLDEISNNTGGGILVARLDGFAYYRVLDTLYTFFYDSPDTSQRYGVKYIAEYRGREETDPELRRQAAGKLNPRARKLRDLERMRRHHPKTRFHFNYGTLKKEIMELLRIKETKDKQPDMPTVSTLARLEELEEQHPGAVILTMYGTLEETIETLLQRNLGL